MNNTYKCEICGDEIKSKHADVYCCSHQMTLINNQYIMSANTAREDYNKSLEKFLDNNKHVIYSILQQIEMQITKANQLQPPVCKIQYPTKIIDSELMKCVIEFLAQAGYTTKKEYGDIGESNCILISW